MVNSPTPIITYTFDETAHSILLFPMEKGWACDLV